MSEIIILNVSGEDKPGLTAAITETLATYNVNILDVGQSVIHNTLVLGILIEIPKEAQSGPILKDALFTAHSLGLHIRFTAIDEVDYNHWVSLQGQARHIVTLLSSKITVQQIARISKIIADRELNIDNISRISGRTPLADQPQQRNACLEFSFQGNPPDVQDLRKEFLQAATELGIDIAMQEDNIYRSNRRLMAFDMDSTLIKVEVIDQLAAAANVGEEVSAITRQAMAGEIDFTESLKRRVSLLKGLDESALANIAENLPLTEGAEKLISTLKRLDYKTAIISGGFDYFGRYLQEKLGIDYVYTNRLEIQDGKLTGNVIGDVVDGRKKADLLERIVLKENISLEQTIAVGDGANDVPMLSKAGLGIAFRAKPIVKKTAEQALSLGLDGILYLIGYRDWYNVD